MTARVVAIDGPSGTGKSTVARAVGAALGWPVLDTGAMYRAVTLAVLDSDVAPTDGAACTAVALRSEVVVDGGVTTLDGRDVSAEIRGPAVTGAVSAVAAHPQVRALLVEQQRAWARAHGCGVVEGRDIGSVVFPDAGVKVYLDASPEERARRRHRDEQAAERAVDVGAVRSAVERRDALDRSRAASPLLVADGGIVIDSTRRSVDEVVDEILVHARRAFG